MGINLRKTSHIIFFAAFLPLVSYFISWWFYEYFPDLPFWMESISPLYVYILFYELFEKYLWNLSIFRYLGIVIFPNLNGRWTGFQHSSHRENSKRVKSKVTFEIKQSFSHICVCSYYQKSDSESVIASFWEHNDKNYLFFTYDNDPNSLKSGTMQKHKGTAKLLFIPVQKKLKGNYFNSLGNSGEIDVKFDRKELQFSL